jgi:hypothetical protein
VAGFYKNLTGWPIGGKSGTLNAPDARARQNDRSIETPLSASPRYGKNLSTRRVGGHARLRRRDTITAGAEVNTDKPARSLIR